MNNRHKTPQLNAQSHQLWHTLYSEFARTDIEAAQIPAVQLYQRRMAGGGGGGGYAQPGGNAGYPGGMHPPQQKGGCTVS
jgi:hypothetical protein